MTFDQRACRIFEVRRLFEMHHGYKSCGNTATYAFAVYENGEPVAAYLWQPPPFGAAKSVCPEAPHAVLSLSRMVAVEKSRRRLKHISKPLLEQMKRLIDRNRWPVLVTYSDEGQGHTGHVYKCSGWTPTMRRSTPVFETQNGVRASSYSAGEHKSHKLVRAGNTFIQRWEHWACEKGRAADVVKNAGWARVPTGGTYKSGKAAFTWALRR